MVIAIAASVTFTGWYQDTSFFVRPVMAATYATQSKGDANCDGVYDVTDFEVFRKEFMRELSTSNADADADGQITVADFEIWRRSYFYPPTTGQPTNTPTNPPASPPTSPPTNTPAVSTATPTGNPSVTIPPGGNVAATVETDPVPHSGDAADDPAIWVNPSNPAQSTIIGTDKQGGLAVYDMGGKQLQYLAIGDMNNVDIRTGFSLGGQQVALVTAGNRTNNSIGIYKVNPSTRLLENVAARVITTTSVYGSCMYKATDGTVYYFINSKSGAVEQWKLFDNGSGKVDGTKVRTFSVGSQTEGCVANDQTGDFYIGEEAVAIWKYSASPTGGTTRTQVDKTGSGGHLTSNIEGLTIAYAPSGTYLMASSQGNSSYVVYRLSGGTATYVKTFKIVDGGGIDGTSGTDGIDVYAGNLGSSFPSGVFVSQDGSNPGGNQNFKLVPLQLILGN